MENHENFCENCKFYQLEPDGSLEPFADGYCKCDNQVHSLVYCDEYCFWHEPIIEEKNNGN